MCGAPAIHGSIAQRRDSKRENNAWPADREVAGIMAWQRTRDKNRMLVQRSLGDFL
jgi:hypothetical protein